MKSGNRVIWLFVLIVVILPITVFGITSWYESHIKRLPVDGPENHNIGSFHFTGQNGQPVSELQWKNKIVVANFFFTSCPAVCPRMLYQLKRVQTYGDQHIVISSFTVDPIRDSAARLKTYAEKFGIKNNWLLLTGNKIDLYRFARKDLLIDATDGDGGPEDFIHSDNLLLIDPDRKIRGYYRGTDETDVNRLIHDIERLKNEFKI